MVYYGNQINNNGNNCGNVTGLYVCNLVQGDAEEVAALEMMCFGKQLATSKEVFMERLKMAQEYSVGMRDATTHQLVAFISASLYGGECLDKDSLTRHEEEGQLLCVHSICTHQDYRRRGIAKFLYVLLCQRVMNSNPRVDQVSLICCKELIPMYESWGLELRGLSEVDLGNLEWYEMTAELM